MYSALHLFLFCFFKVFVLVLKFKNVTLVTAQIFLLLRTVLFSTTVYCSCMLRHLNLFEMGVCQLTSGCSKAFSLEHCFIPFFFLNTFFKGLPELSFVCRKYSCVCIYIYTHFCTRESCVCAYAPTRYLFFSFHPSVHSSIHLPIQSHSLRAVSYSMGKAIDFSVFSLYFLSSVI